MSLQSQVALGILVPFIGTTLGASMVVFLRGGMKDWVRKVLWASPRAS